MISGFVFGSGSRHDLNISMAHDGRLPVVGIFPKPGAHEAAKAKAKAKAKGKAKAKAAAWAGAWEALSALDRRGSVDIARQLDRSNNGSSG